MRDMTGLKPYQELAQSAKNSGGPENYTREIFKCGFNSGLFTAGSVIVLGVAAYFGLKKLSEFMCECD